MGDGQLRNTGLFVSERLGCVCVCVCGGGGGCMCVCLRGGGGGGGGAASLHWLIHECTLKLQRKTE